MGMLVVYCLKDLNFNSIEDFVPALIASSVVAVSYIVKRKTLLSIFAGIIVYMLLLQFIF